MDVPDKKTGVDVSTAAALVIIWRRFMVVFPRYGR